MARRDSAIRASNLLQGKNRYNSVQSDEATQDRETDSSDLPHNLGLNCLKQKIGKIKTEENNQIVTSSSQPR